MFVFCGIGVSAWFFYRYTHSTGLRLPLFADETKIFYIRDNELLLTADKLTQIRDASKSGKLVIWRPFTDRERLMGMHLIHFSN